MVRQLTASYPDNPRSEWARRDLVLPHYEADGLLHFAYEVYPTAKSRDAGDRPFLLNSHKAMVRESHQRIALDANGYMRHRSGIAVPPDQVQEFLRTDPRAYRWMTPWRDDRGRELLPFMFPNYQGRQEALDPQWLRETHIVPQAQQVAELVDLYLRGAEARRLSGDHRGTTIDVQVGASADDAQYAQVSGTYFISDDAAEFVGSSGGGAFASFYRFTGGSGLSGATIDVSYISTMKKNANAGTPLTKIRAERANTPAAPTTAADARSRVLTTAGVDWDNAPGAVDAWVDSPSTNTVFQEIADNQNPTVIIVFHLDDGGVGESYYWFWAYDGNTTKAPKLHIEYTAGGGSVPVFAHHYSMMRRG